MTITACTMFFLVWFLLLAVPSSIQATDTLDAGLSKGSQNVSDPSKTIAHIFVNGNHTTKERVIRLFLNIDTGSVYDSLQIVEARKSLLATNLFTKVDILTLRKSYGIDLYVIVYEQYYLGWYDLGGELYSQKYRINEVWWRLRLGLAYSNVGGDMQEIRTSISFWDWRSFGISWTKPYLPTPFFTTLGASISYYPDDIAPNDYLDVTGKASLGRKFGKKSRVSFSLIPTFRKQTNVLSDKVTKFYEAYDALSWITDYRNKTYTPSRGWMLSNELKTNYLYPGDNNGFVQLSSDLRFYHKGFFKSDNFAAKLGLVLRNTDAGETHRLTYGGESTVRGYSSRSIGNDLHFLANNSFLFSAEYRVHFWQTPSIPMPLLSLLYEGTEEIYYRIDGALIFNGVTLMKDIRDIKDFPNANTVSAIGAGVGLRIHAPQVQHTACIDMMFAEQPGNTRGHSGLAWPPMLHFYLDLYY